MLVVAGWVNRQQQDVIDYLQKENRVLRAGLRGKRVVSKNTNELKTRALGRFGLEVSRLGWPMEAEILGHENADPAFNMVGGRHRWLGPA